jgi:CHASE2 domain-containing sensor protein
LLLGIPLASFCSRILSKLLLNLLLSIPKLIEFAWAAVCGLYTYMGLDPGMPLSNIAFLDSLISLAFFILSTALSVYLSFTPPTLAFLVFVLLMEGWNVHSSFAFSNSYS